MPSGARVGLADPIFQGLAISLMAGEIASLLNKLGRGAEAADEYCQAIALLEPTLVNHPSLAQYYREYLGMLSGKHPAEEIARVQAKLEALPVKLEGDRYVQPKPTDTKNALITHERKGDEIHYSRHDAATGAPRSRRGPWRSGSDAIRRSAAG